MTSWTDFKKIISQLKTEAVRAKFDTIVIDTISIATDLCEKYILNQNDVKSLSEIPWGQGWSMYKKEFEQPLRELSQLGYGIVFIAHSKNVPTGQKDVDGNAISKVYPDINKTGLNAANRLVDVIGYLSTEWDENGNNTRWLYTRETPTVFAGARYKYIAPKIPLGYNELVNAIADAIEQEVQHGAQTTDKTDMSYLSRQNYNDVMDEAKQLWIKLTAGNQENAIKIRTKIAEVFGRDMKLSEAKEDEADKLQQIVDFMKIM